MPQPDTVDEPRPWHAKGGWVPIYLRERGLAAAGETVRVEPIGGGVSAEVFEVQARTAALVVKKALPELDVADTWTADPRRAITEGRALRLARTIAPGAVPKLIDLDEREAILTMERAPASWSNWRSELLAGDLDGSVPVRVGEALAEWHRETDGSASVRETFGDARTFEDLRLRPFHETTTAAHPSIAAPIAAAVERLREEKRCLVHGDVSPKNVLFGDDGAWVLDWEVAHLGAPIFDLAFLLSHLVLKSVHRPLDAEGHRALAASFLSAYAGRGGLVDPEDPGLTPQIGCLVLARVDGKSPVPYLTAEQRSSARRLGVELLAGPERTDPLSAWDASR